MTANTSPIYPLTPNVSGVNVTAANTKSDGAGTIGTDLFKAFTAGANGSWITKVRVQPTATAASTATTQTVVRFFLSSLTSGTTAPGTDTWPLGELPLAAQTADSPTVGQIGVEYTLNVAIPAGYTLLAATHHAPATNTGQSVVVFGGDY